MRKQIKIIAAVLTIGVSSAALMHPAISQDMKDPAAAEKIDNNYWWPNRLDLTPLRMNDAAANPLGADFDYAQAFESLDLNAVKDDLKTLMHTSQDWWPSDFGHYGPFFIRMAWHSAGTYRTIDGRGGGDGGQQRFAPLNSWPDNVNLDKARLLLWPIKEKYGNKISWGDLMVLAGTVAMEDMGFETIGFAGGREDNWTPEEVDWGPEGEWLGSSRRDDKGSLKGSLAATHMGLIYVNPEGPPGGKGDPLKAAQAIREAFGRMAMNDEETVALIVGGHTFGKAHGAADPTKHVGAEPERTGVEDQGLGWKNSYGTGKGADTITSGLEGAWTATPTKWSNNYLENLYNFEWVETKSPAGAVQWVPKDEELAQFVPDAHDPDKMHAPIMFTTDIALKEYPEYAKITKRFHDDPKELEHAFAKAWFKLTHRDMGPQSRYLGAFVPKETFIWQDPVPAVDHPLVNAADITKLKGDILASGLTVPELVRTAWASASTFRDTDMRGGANGARVRLEPQLSWDANDKAEIEKVTAALDKICGDFNKGEKKISLADMIVLGGAAAIEKAAKDAGHDVTVPFKPGRTDATQEMTDVAAFNFLEPKADGFRNYFAAGNPRSPAEMLVEKAALMNLTVPEMTALVGGLRALDANADGAKEGVFTDKPGTLSNDFFVNLLDMGTEWKKVEGKDGIYEGHDRASGAAKWTASPVDLIFGSNSELRAVSEVYAQGGAEDKFIKDFVDAWTKVMTLDRFDLS